MTDRRWLAILVVVGIAIFALSFVDAWIAHDREVRGEGYRFVQIVVSAWREPGFPVITIGAVAALLVGIGAALTLFGLARAPTWVLLAGASLALGVFLAGLAPVSQDGLASSVDLKPGVLLLVGIGLAAVMVVAAVALVRPGPRLIGAVAVIGLVAVISGSGGRWLGLQLAEGDGRHWSDGSYTRMATGDQPTETLTISGDRVTIGDRWSGSWEWSGWVVSIEDDPACPDSRGTYHAHGEDEEDLRFVMLVDTCADGERAADLQAGIWERDP